MGISAQMNTLEGPELKKKAKEPGGLPSKQTSEDYPAIDRVRVLFQGATYLRTAKGSDAPVRRSMTSKGEIPANIKYLQQKDYQGNAQARMPKQHSPCSSAMRSKLGSSSTNEALATQKHLGML